MKPCKIIVHCLYWLRCEIYKHRIALLCIIQQSVQSSVCGNRDLTWSATQGGYEITRKVGGERRQLSEGWLRTHQQVAVVVHHSLDQLSDDIAAAALHLIRTDDFWITTRFLKGNVRWFSLVFIGWFIRLWNSRFIHILTAHIYYSNKE